MEGLAHEKFGIFTDKNGDKVAFTGSMNLTATALVKILKQLNVLVRGKVKITVNALKLVNKILQKFGMVQITMC